MEEVTFTSEDERTRYDAELYEIYDDMLRCGTAEGARDYIDGEWESLSIQEKETVVKTFFCLTNRTKFERSL